MRHPSMGFFFFSLPTLHCKKIITWVKAYNVMTTEGEKSLLILQGKLIYSIIKMRGENKVSLEV